MSFPSILRLLPLLLLLLAPCQSFTTVIRQGMRKSGAAQIHLTPHQVLKVPPPSSASALKATTDTDTTQEEDVDSMRIGALKQELESYGINTKVFLEKKELVEALKKARADGLKPKATTTSSSATSSQGSTTTSSSSSSSSNTASTSSTSSSSTPKDARPREERLTEEISKCEKMKNSELKQELKELGISTASFFEKSEFVKALATARVDGVSKKTGSSSSSSSSNEEGYAEYADVEVLTDNSTGPRPKGAGEQTSASSSPFGGGSPFGGAAGGNPFGGGGADMGGFGDMLKNMQGGGGGGGGAGMGGFGDMLKNMQGMGGGAAGGANPFAGMGDMGGMGGMGDAMGKAQEMMKNPKVMELFTKAQKNPKMMKAMQECMSNPAAISKYQNDPEIAELVNELKKYM